MRLWESENNRNADNADVFAAIIHEAFDDVVQVFTGHHVMFTVVGQLGPTEIPSADYLIFDHHIARRIWGDRYREVLTMLALEPIGTRDALLRRLFNERRTT